MDSSEYLDLFVSEAREHIEGAARLLAHARVSPLGREEINDLFRHAHSLKGMSAALGLAPITALAHAMEDVLHGWRDGALAPDPAALALLTRANDHLSVQVDAALARAQLPSGGDLEAQLRALRPEAEPPVGPAPAAPARAVESRVEPASRTEDPRPRLLIDVAIRPDAPLPGARALVILKRLQEHGKVLEISPSPQVLATGRFSGRLRVVLASPIAIGRLASLAAGLPDVVACQVTPAEASVVGGEDERPGSSKRRNTDRTDDETPGAKDGPSLRTKDGTPVPEGISTIRVATERMDHLLDGIGELILDHERLKTTLVEEGSRAMEILEGLGRTVDRLRHEVMTMRLLPFSSVVPRLERSLRELSSRLGKEVDLEVRGADVSLDRSTLEEMIDPLQHILRNSIDHGLEPAEARRTAGKPERGRIEIELSRRDERIRLVVSDDGRGMDPGALRRVAVERGFLTREAAGRLSDEEALMLVTIPGFSTAKHTTEISGRGVGMDVVRMRVQKLGGHLLIRSKIGVGTRLELNLPSTVTVTRAFLCRAGDGIFAVPVSTVSGTLEVQGERVQSSQGERVLRRGDDLVTVLALGGVLSRDRATPFPSSFPALLYKVGRRTYALGVDEILGEEPIVVKPLRHPLEILPQYAGAAILNDGRIALIVDPVTLTRASRHA